MEARRPRRESLRFEDDSPIPLPVEPRQKLRLSPREVADILGPGWTEDTVRAHVKAGGIPGQQVGNRTVVYRQQPEEWLRGTSVARRSAALRERIEAAIDACDKAARELRDIKERL